MFRKFPIEFSPRKYKKIISLFIFTFWMIYINGKKKNYPEKKEKKMKVIYIGEGRRKRSDLEKKKTKGIENEILSQCLVVVYCLPLEQINMRGKML